MPIVNNNQQREDISGSCFPNLDLDNRYTVAHSPDDTALNFVSRFNGDGFYSEFPVAPRCSRG
ncbi:hypothetical protein G5I_10183 [Acromyrmex echinatior]|uniref:Uncharacterized protein n=1 Tax=Acromyrmex echinatior TaxID=103372 RepID=F4WW29_ACREC|nr:hypothetical protein G5I_10183 [Acromyrmex echinatior]